MRCMHGIHTCNITNVSRSLWLETTSSCGSCCSLLSTKHTTANVNAVSRTYTWYPPSNQAAFNVYSETKESWQMDASLEVLVKFTLIADYSSLNRVDIKWTRIEITDRQTFLVNSGKMEETSARARMSESTMKEELVSSHHQSSWLENKIYRRCH